LFFRILNRDIQPRLSPQSEITRELGFQAATLRLSDTGVSRHSEIAKGFGRAANPSPALGCAPMRPPALRSATRLPLTRSAQQRAKSLLDSPKLPKIRINESPGYLPSANRWGRRNRRFFPSPVKYAWAE
jgi:hypothetical protein